MIAGFLLNDLSLWHLAKPISRTFGKDEKTMVQIKRDWFDTALENYERGETHGRWKEKIQV